MSGKALACDVVLNVNPQRILIIKPSSLGDIIHALPTLAALRSKFPHAWIAWLVKENWAEILEGNPLLNEVLAVGPNMTQWWDMLHVIRKQDFDLVVDLQGLLRSAFMAKMSGASVIVGFAQGRECSPWFYTHRVKLPIPSGTSWRLWNMHAVDRNLAVAKFLGAECDVPQFCLPSHEDDRQAVDQWLKAGNVTESDKLVAIAPLTRQPIKNWPLERFVQVAQSLIELNHVKIVLVGTEDPHVSRQFEAALGSQCVNLMGKTRVRQLSVLLDKVSLLIANDSAPLHIAAARGIPLLTIFGPTNPESTGPYGMSADSQVMTHALPCQPCGERTCRNAIPLECLTASSVNDVVGHATRILSKSEI